MLIEEKLREIFALSLQIKGAQFSHTPSAETVHVFRIKENVEVAEYEVDISGYYADWCEDSHENSLNNAIKRTKELVKQQ